MKFTTKLTISIKIIPILFLGLLLSGCFGPAIQVKKDDFTGDTHITMALILRAENNGRNYGRVLMDFIRAISKTSEKTNVQFKFSTGGTRQNLNKDNFDAKISIDGAITDIRIQSVDSSRHVQGDEEETNTYFTIDGSLLLDSKSTTKLKTAGDVKFRFSYNGNNISISVDEKQLELIHEFFNATGEEETK
ncbi:MAG: hypothetical protein ABUK01_03630 [Leptospirales bacterium]